MTEQISVALTSAIPVQTLTIGQAKTNVARVIGNETDPKTLARAYDALCMAAAEWNRRHQFDINALTAADISVVAATAAYDLPSNFLHMYSVRMKTNSERDLDFLRMRHYDRSYWDQEVEGYPTHYTLFGHGNTGQIQLLPTPSGTDTLQLRYYAAVTCPSGNGETFGIPDRYAWGLVYKAKALLLLDKNAEDNRIPHWEREAEMAFRQARADDSEYPDEDLRMIPAMEHRRRLVSPSHPDYFTFTGE